MTTMTRPGAPLLARHLEVRVDVHDRHSGGCFEGHAVVDVRLDRSGDDATPDGPPEVVVHEVRGLLAPTGYVAPHAVCIEDGWPSWLQEHVEDAAVAVALELEDEP